MLEKDSPYVRKETEWRKGDLLLAMTKEGKKNRKEERKRKREGRQY